MTASPYQVSSRIALLGIALIWIVAETSRCNKFCKKNASPRKNNNTLSGWIMPRFFTFAGGAYLAAAAAIAVLTLLLASANAAPSEEQRGAGASVEFNKEDGTLYIDWLGPIVAGMADDLRAALDRTIRRLVRCYCLQSV
jgi:hypothetical protein